MINNEYSYNQPMKKKVRHDVISKAVHLLTQDRGKAACIDRTYVRSLYDFFVNIDEESKNKNEASEINTQYIVSWENLHDTYTSIKNIRDLVVCYLCGPEPNNDFQEFLDYGILPQNIWAFESDKKTYDTAISKYQNGEYPQPRILKQNIETFFKHTPKKFDIVYIDACGSVPSTQHALRTIYTLCLNSRLNSPGVIITNFSSPNQDKVTQFQDWAKLIATYFYFKQYPEDSFIIENGNIISEKYNALCKSINNDFRYYYGEFISALLRDIPSVIVPVQRIDNNPYIKQFVKDNSYQQSNQVLIDMAKGYSLARFFFYVDEVSDYIKGTKLETLLGELGDVQSIINGFKLIIGIRSGIGEVKEDIREIREYFETHPGLYRFLDKPHCNIVFDAIINQLTYPLHFNPEPCLRLLYKAKEKEMYTDVSFYDECRYVYEWIPAIHQIISAFDNKSWQYVFRFCIDGLIRSRIGFNNEFFYQGSVVTHNQGDFIKAEIDNRIDLCRS